MKWLTKILVRLALKLPGANEGLRVDAFSSLRAAIKGDETFVSDFLSRPEAAPALLTALRAKNGALLKRLLSSPQDAAVQSLFRELALSGDCAPLKTVLFDDDYRILRKLLSLRGHEALRAIVLDGPPTIYRMLVVAREGKPLSEILFADDARVLRDLCGAQERDALAPLFSAEKKRFLSTLSAEACLGVLAERKVDGEELFVLLHKNRLLPSVLESKRWRESVALLDTWRRLVPHLPEGGLTLPARMEAALGSLSDTERARDLILDGITEGDVVDLASGSLRFPCRHSLWTLLHEILIQEDYFFRCATESPRIIDGGTHMGMAIYYFKTLFPGARITGFEPVPNLYEIALENVARNGYADVTIEPMALAAREGAAQFFVSESWTMAGSLENRRERLGDDLSAVPVQCVPLSAWLDEPVDFLKLDIEGAEAEVLVESREKLRNVHHIFCEVHLGGGADSGRLAAIVALLEETGFDIQVGKSHNFQETSRHRPFTHFDGGASLLVWARNRVWGF